MWKVDIKVNVINYKCNYIFLCEKSGRSKDMLTVVKGNMTQKYQFLNFYINKNYSMFRYECNKRFLVKLALNKFRRIYLLSRRPN